MPAVLMVMNPLGAYLLTKGANPRVMVFIGASIMILSLYSITLTRTFEELLVIWAIKLIGAGFCYFAPLMTGWEWWEGQEGIVTGVVLGAFGFSSFIFSFMASHIINPKNEQPMHLPDGQMIYSPEIAARVSRSHLVSQNFELGPNFVLYTDNLFHCTWDNWPGIHKTQS